MLTLDKTIWTDWILDLVWVFELSGSNGLEGRREGIWRGWLQWSAFACLLWVRRWAVLASNSSIKVLLHLWAEQTELMWGKTNHILLSRIPEVLDTHPHVWCRWKEPTWFPGAFSGDHHRRATSPLSALSSAFLVPVVTVLTSWKTFTPVIGLLGKTALGHPAMPALCMHPVPAVFSCHPICQWGKVIHCLQIAFWTLHLQYSSGNSRTLPLPLGTIVECLLINLLQCSSANVPNDG